MSSHPYSHLATSLAFLYGGKQQHREQKAHAIGEHDIKMLRRGHLCLVTKQLERDRVWDFEG